ncbi:MAG: hypothetical protein KGH55_02665 [Nanoarchaeota archaeon]|nr:hypothetical protein [Nanoarchaeota archaeon]
MEESGVEKKVIENLSGALAMVLIGPVPESVRSYVYSLYVKARGEFNDSYETLHWIFSSSLY